jgi:hypothetical protein
VKPPPSPGSSTCQNITPPTLFITKNLFDCFCFLVKAAVGQEENYKTNMSSTKSMKVTSESSSTEQWLDTADNQWKPYPGNVEVVKGNIIDVELWQRNSDERKLICQQNNCVATKGHGLSETIFKAFPFADIYEERRLLNQRSAQKRRIADLDENSSTKKLRLADGTEVALGSSLTPSSSRKTVSSNRTPMENRGKPGTVEFRQKDKIVVVNMIAQIYTGACDRFGNTDTSKQREQWFQQCLDKIEVYLNESKETKTSIAFPWNIGCGLAKGNPTNYLAMLMKFASKVPDTRVVMIKFQ